MSTKRVNVADDVRTASDRFYEALNEMAKGDAGPMSAVWSHRDDVTTMHPIGGREVGWKEVQGPWEAVAEMSEGGSIEPTDRLIRVEGDLAYELVTEKGSMTLGGEEVDVDYRATNVYRLEDSDWKMVHHHTDLSREFVDVIQRMEAGE